MSRTYKDSGKYKPKERHISVRAIRRDPPDLRKLSRALIELAMAEAAAQAETQNNDDPNSPDSNGRADEATHD